MRRGQTTVEYLLAISVISIAIAASMGVLWSTLTDSTDDLANEMATELVSGGVQ